MPMDGMSKGAGLWHHPAWDGADGHCGPLVVPSGGMCSGKEHRLLRGIALSLSFVFSSPFSLG